MLSFLFAGKGQIDGTVLVWIVTSPDPSPGC